MSTQFTGISNQIQKPLRNSSKSVIAFGKGPSKVGMGRKKRRGKAKYGAGFFDDVWNTVKSVGSKVGDIALNKGADLIFKKVLGGKRRKKHKVRRY